MKAPTGFMRKQDAAKFMGCTTRTIDNWMNLGLVPFYKLGRSVYLKEQDFIQSLEAGKVAKKCDQQITK